MSLMSVLYEGGVFNFGGCGIGVSFDAPINFHASLSLMLAIASLTPSTGSGSGGAPTEPLVVRQAY
jgi:hypothetical protein